jgi:predicted SPOUT superfamily RNA methylase MTH1
MLGLFKVIELLKETNSRLNNMEVLLEFLLTPPDLKKYMIDKKNRLEKSTSGKTLFR